MTPMLNAVCNSLAWGFGLTPMKKFAALIHCVMECETCGKKFENYKNGQALAAKHAKDHKHKVSGEVGLSVEYDGTENEQ